MSEMITWSPGITLEEIERQVILKAIRFYRFNKTTTAQALGIAIRTLDNKLEKYEVDAKQEKKKEEDDKRRREEFLARSRGLPQGPDGGAIYAGTGYSSHPASGPNLESIANSPTQSQMPMSERPQIQTMLQEPIASSRNKKTR